MVSIAGVHHHRNTTKVSHKPYKSRHATKGILKDILKGDQFTSGAPNCLPFVGKVEKSSKSHNHKSLSQRVMSKVDRRNQSRQKQQAKHQERAKSTSVFSGQNGAPRIVVVVPLSEDVGSSSAIQSLNDSLDLEATSPSPGLCTVRIERFKQSVQYVTTQRNLLYTLDACKAADFVLFVLSPTQEVGKSEEWMLRAIENQGASNVFTVVQGLGRIEPSKRRSQVMASLKSYISHFFPNQGKLHSLDSRQECANLIRSICTLTPKGIHWRDERSWMFVDEVNWLEEGDSGMNSVAVTGVVRGKGLKANRLLQLGDWGAFQIEKIVSAPLPNQRKRKADEMAVDGQEGSGILEEPDADQDDLAELADEDIIMDEANGIAVSEAPTERKGVLLDDHHYFDDDEGNGPELPKRVPKGTSSYQAAWYLGDMSDSGSDWENTPDHDTDVAMASTPSPQDGIEALDSAVPVDPTEVGPSEYPQSEMFLDPSPEDEADQIAEFASRRKNEAAEDLEFPDEIELHPNVVARERLAKYRGLKNFRTSIWDTDEDKAYEPEEWIRLLRISNYKAAKNKSTREASVDGVLPGTRVQVYLLNVSSSIRESVSNEPITAFSLLQHEQKRTVLNFSITLDSEQTQPVKSKEEIIMQCGPRRFAINPLFSAAGTTPNDVHKFDRYLHPGHTAIASFTGPLTWGSVPTLFFRRCDHSPQHDADASRPPPPLQLIGTGTSNAAAPSPSRVVAKRVVLTGHPYKIHKRLVTVRYMFFSADDVRWFRALRLWTRRGRSGFIKESLGTHGYFKATFDGHINPQDAVAVSLFKRVWPRQCRAWRLEDETGRTEEAEGGRGGALEGSGSNEVEMATDA